MRPRLLVLTLIVLAGMVAIGGFLLERRMRTWLESRAGRELGRQASLARELIEDASARGGGDLDGLADRAARAAGVRVTIFDPAGVVVGDSELDREQVASAAEPDRRDQVRDALAGDVVRARADLAAAGGREMSIAVPYRTRHGTGALRLSTPVDEIDRAVFRARVLMVAAALACIALAVVAGSLGSYRMSRSLRDLVDSARALAGGDRAPIGPGSRDELGRLAGSIHRMSEELGRTMAALAGERNLLETVLGSMGDAVLAVDGETRIRVANPAAARLLRIEGPPEGRLLLEVVRLPALKELLARATHDAETVAAELELPRIPTRRVLVRATPLREPAGHVVVLQDVTEMRQLETVRRDFVANVSHELRTPVSVILGSSETLLDGAMADGASARRFLEAIHGNAERLARLIADLLDLSRIEAGRWAMEVRSVAVDAALGRAAEAVAEPARRKGQSIEVARADGLVVAADPEALDQVLLNLLDNAVKYTPAGGRIRLDARRVDGRVRAEVTDDGPGIELRHQERVFERFYRVDPGRSRDMGGTGLGLSIVKHLVEAMGGQVGFEAVEPHGSRFWLTLPEAGAPPAA
jgi:two-component system phosphate regulon sensor histidine kinase PhoR